MMRFYLRVAPLLITFASLSSAQAQTVPIVPVGDPGNPADTRYDPLGIGSVGYDYSIGATEVTNSHYVEFLNAVAAADFYGLFNPDMAATTLGGIIQSGAPGAYTYFVKPAVGDYTYDDKPVVHVSWYDAIRFANWLHNGQGSGDTETGAYTLKGGTPTPTDGNSIGRNPEANWFLPTKDEWYKAAFYDPVAGVYHNYPTGSDSVPDNNLPAADTGNSANYNDGTLTTGNAALPFTDAGAYALSMGPNGTFDQGGNVSEWIEELRFSTFRVKAGGNFMQGASFLSASLYGGGQSPTSEGFENGFRVATILSLLPGDYNQDGSVDAADYVLWRKTPNNFGGDPDGHDTWRAHFGEPGGGGSGASANAAVPEPATLVLQMFALLGLCRRRGRASSKVPATHQRVTLSTTHRFGHRPRFRETHTFNGTHSAPRKLNSALGLTLGSLFGPRNTPAKER